jgi:hypothetical protein
MDTPLAFDMLKLVPGLVLGLALLFLPSRYRDRAERIHAKKLADRLARGSDSYFEELRSLRAYQPPRSAGPWQVLGAILTFLSAFLIYERVNR